MALKKELVNLFIVGAPKAGTTFLSNYLKSQSFISISIIKEPNYFSSDINPNHFTKNFSNELINNKHVAFIRNIEEYHKLFDFKKILRLDSSTSYLYSKNAARRIFDYNSNAKIIICLRNPIDRMISHFKMDIMNGRIPLTSLSVAIEKDLKKNQVWGNASLYVELSLYSNQITRYLNVFPRNQILFLDFNIISKKPNELNSILSDFLNRPIEMVDIDEKHQNKSYYFPKFITVISKLKIIKKIARYLGIIKTLKLLKLKFGQDFKSIQNQNDYFISTSLQQELKSDYKRTLKLIK